MNGTEELENLIRRELLDDDDAPELAADLMLSKVGTIRRRRRLTAVGSAGLAAAVAAVLAVVAPGLHGDQDETATPTGPTTLQAVYLLDFVDRNTGFALTANCTPPSPDAAAIGSANCRLRLLSTNDGGTTWRRRTLPNEAGLAASLPRSPGLAVRSATSLVLIGQFQRWTSTDAGTSWQEQHELDTSAAIPSGARIMPADLSDPPVADTVDPSGTVRRLQVPADVKLRIVANPAAGVPPAADGSYWLLCDPGGHGAGSCVVRVTDGGRAWTRIAALRQTGASQWSSIDDYQVVTLDGRTVYLMTRVTKPGSNMADSAETMSMLMRSTDGGENWDQIGLPNTAKGFDQMTPLANGDLLIDVFGDGTYRYRPGAEVTLERLAAGGAQEMTMGRSGPYLLRQISTSSGDDQTATRSERYEVSADEGVSWRDLKLPN